MSSLAHPRVTTVFKMGKFLARLISLSTAMLVLCLAAPLARAHATDIGGTLLVDTTWTASGSPQVLVNDLAVAQGVTLRVMPGVSVQFQPGTNLLVGGKLVARGTAESPISFTSTGATRLITFQNSAVDATYDGGGQYVDGCILEYAKLNNVGADASGSGPYFDHVDVSNGDIVVSYADKACVVDSTLAGSSNNRFYAESVGETLMRGNFVTGGALGAKWTTGTITSNYILNGQGIVTGGGWSSQQYTITDNIIVGSGQIHVGTLAEPGQTRTQLVANNLIYRSHGSYQTANAESWWRSGQVTSTFRNNIIAESTLVPGSDHGVVRSYSEANGGYATVVEHNSIVNNVYDSALRTSTNGGYGIYAVGGYVLTRHNTLVGNDTNDVSHIGFGVLGIERGSNFNLFEDNNVYGNDMYAFFNQGTPDVTVTAASNHWGTTNSVELNALIYDKNDDIDVGPVVYQPVLEQPDPDAPVPPPINFAVTPVDGGLHLAWDKVRAIDVTGCVVYYDTDNDAFPYEGQDANEGQSPVRLGDVGEYTLTGLETGKPYYVAVTAYDTADNTSLPLLKNQLAGHHSWYSKIESEVVYPIADFGVPLSQMNAGEPFQFNDASLGTVTGRLWEFGDGGTSTETNPVHTYVDQGTFSVTLTVTGPGGTDSEGKQNYVTIVRRPTTTLHTNPTSPNGHDEYYTVVPEIGLVPDETATTWIQWDTTSGAWSQYSTTITALEGSHRLYYYSVDLGSLEETPAKHNDFKVDTLPPEDPLLSSPSHALDAPSSDSTVGVIWVGAWDAVSGVDGYSTVWSPDSPVAPNDTKDHEETVEATTSPPLADGAWHFNLRTVDNAGNWSSTISIGPFYIDTAAPTVTHNSPASDATDVPTNTAVTATFSESMNGSSVEAAMSVTGPAGSIAGTATYDGPTKKVTFTPSGPLSWDTTYTAIISTGAEDLAGNGLASEFRWSFKTAAAPAISTTLALVARQSSYVYGSTITLSGSLSAAGIPLADRDNVSVWTSSDGVAWTADGTASWVSATFSYEVSRAIRAKAVYQFRFGGAPGCLPSVSRDVTATCRAYLSRPAAPLAVRRNAYFTLYGHLKPRHSGTTRLHFYRYYAGRWRFYRYANASNSDFYDYTKYRLRYRVPYAGRWRVRARHACPDHLTTYSRFEYYGAR